MSTFLQNWLHSLTRTRADEVSTENTPIGRPTATVPAVEIAPSDPLFAYFLTSPGAVDLENLTLDSPALREMLESGVKLALPLVSQGELVGVMSLGPRLSEQEYTGDDRRLLSNLATRAAPALRVAQLARLQQVEARERERIEQELRVAGIIQQTLLPKETPALPGWGIAAYWQPARAVGGDFYDFIPFEDGRLAIVVADVTDKGVPAALVMASARSILRAAAERLESPGAVLASVNNMLCPDIPAKMFVTCLYMVLDPATGRVQYANAGHNLPNLRSADGKVIELRATGMPLGLMPGMDYEEQEATLLPGQSVLLYSDGLVEAHAPDGEMYGFPRLAEKMASCPGSGQLISHLENDLRNFTGEGWEQEDDVTLLVVERMPEGVSSTNTELASFMVESTPGNERSAVEQVIAATETLPLTMDQQERLKTAIAEATMNAMEHGNHYDPDLPVRVDVLTSGQKLIVRIIDQGGSVVIPESEVPDIEAKLAGEQSPRGWGLFLIENMVDEMRATQQDGLHILELTFGLGGSDDGQTA